jgi:hypothetical protein
VHAAVPYRWQGACCRWCTHHGSHCCWQVTQSCTLCWLQQCMHAFLAAIGPCCMTKHASPAADLAHDQGSTLRPPPTPHPTHSPTLFTPSPMPPLTLCPCRPPSLPPSPGPSPPTWACWRRTRSLTWPACLPGWHCSTCWRSRRRAGDSSCQGRTARCSATSGTTCLQPTISCLPPGASC